MGGVYFFHANFLIQLAKTHIDTTAFQPLFLSSSTSDFPENGHIVVADCGCAVWLSGKCVAGGLGYT